MPEFTPGANPADICAALTRRRKPHTPPRLPETKHKVEVVRLTEENKRLTKQISDAREELTKAKARIQELETTVQSQGRAGAIVAAKAAKNSGKGKEKPKLTEQEILASTKGQQPTTQTPNDTHE